MPLLLVPLGLVLLAASAIPLLIHLRRRPPEQEIPFAALRWLTAAAPPRRRLRWQERLLLLLRLLLIATLALLLAAPVLRGPGGDASAWVLLVPGADPSTASALLSGDGERRWLAPGFPPIDTDTGTGTAAALDGATLSSLIRERAALHPPDAGLDIVVPHTLAGLDAERLALPRPVGWQVVPGSAAGADPVPADAVRPRLSTAGADRQSAPDRSLAPWLALAACLLFAAERLLAARSAGRS